METTIDQVQEVGSSFLDSARHIFEIVVNTLKPGFEVALPIVQKGSEQAFNIASPLLSEASKTAQQAIQSTGFDTAPVVTAAKVRFPPFFFLLLLYVHWLYIYDH